jgi:ABC-2 type transport system ATP-binding protein
VLTLDQDVSQAPTLAHALTLELRGSRRLAISYDKRETDVGKLLSDLASHGFGITDLSTEESNLEDVFLAMTADK